MPLHAGPFTHRPFYTQTLLHKDPFTFPAQTLSHTDPFTHRCFYTQKLLHKDPFTHRRLYTQLLLHTAAFTTKLAQSTSQYYFVLQSLQNLHKVRPSTTSYYKSCKKCVPVLLRTTKLAQRTFQYYFVLQSLKYFPVLLRTTKRAKLAKSVSQYYFVLQNLHKVRPSTTWYYKACKKSRSQ